MKMQIDIGASLQTHQSARINRSTCRKYRAEIRNEESRFAMISAKNWNALSERIMKFLTEYPDGFRPDYARFYIVTRLTYPIGIIGHAAFIVIFWHLDLKTLAIYNIFSLVLFLFAAVQTNRGKDIRLPSILTVVIEVPTHAILATIYTGPASGFWLHFFLSIVFVLLFPFYSRRVRLWLSAVLILALVVLISFTIGEEPIQHIANEWILFFIINNVLIFATVVVAVISSYELAVVNAEDAMQEEFDRAEMLLLNILPVDIASRLKAHEEPLADTHENVSVLFADLAGFTDISRNLTADELVNLLNDLFSRFDKLANEYGAEKIKTIGDAYMVATGLKGSAGDHVEKIADLALGMQRAFGEFRQDNQVDLKLRIGVHSGSVIAGVIGKQKFSYDLWGDTVNIASRMESEGIPDQIQISAETWEMLPDRYQTSSRGEIQVKGHRPRSTYLLEGHA